MTGSSARRLVVLVLMALVGALCGLVPASPARAQDDSAAIAVNLRDGASIFRFAFSVRRAMGAVVDNSNAAVAYSSCEECRTIAIAVQIVFITGDAQEVTPENVAVAINDNCTLCETLASAYQFVLGGGDPVRLTRQGRDEIREIRRSFRQLGRSDLSIEDIAGQADALADRIRSVLGSQLVPVRDRRDNDDERPTTTSGQPPTSPATSPDDTPTPSAPTTAPIPGDVPPATTTAPGLAPPAPTTTVEPSTAPAPAPAPTAPPPATTSPAPTTAPGPATTGIPVPPPTGPTSTDAQPAPTTAP